jgi:hypothetical protein
MKAAIRKPEGFGTAEEVADLLAAGARLAARE